MLTTLLLAAVLSTPLSDVPDVWTGNTQTRTVLDIVRTKYLAPCLDTPLPCGIEEIVTWESKNKQHTHWMVFVLVTLTDAQEQTTLRLGLLFTAQAGKEPYLDAIASHIVQEAGPRD